MKNKHEKEKKKWRFLRFSASIIEGLGFIEWIHIFFILYKSISKSATFTQETSEGKHFLLCSVWMLVFEGLGGFYHIAKVNSNCRLDIWNFRSAFILNLKQSGCATKKKSIHFQCLFSFSPKPAHSLSSSSVQDNKSSCNLWANVCDFYGVFY